MLFGDSTGVMQMMLRVMQIFQFESYADDVEEVFVQWSHFIYFTEPFSRKTFLACLHKRLMFFLFFFKGIDFIMVTICMREQLFTLLSTVGMSISREHYQSFCVVANQDMLRMINDGNHLLYITSLPTQIRILAYNNSSTHL